MATKNQFYINDSSLYSINREIESTEKTINSLFGVLATENEATIEVAREYQIKGATYKRDAIIAECEDYIQANPKMPQYIQTATRQTAETQISAEYVEKLDQYLPSLEKLELIPDNIFYDTNMRRWCISQSYKDQLLAQADRVLDDEEQQIFEAIKSVFKTLDSIAKTHEARHLVKLYGTALKDEDLAYKVATHRNPLSEEEARRLFPERFPLD